ncbi:hypothetical protein OIO90_005721 [Microbotryomycetes sp. JL221]|nr:hypothetical protein OIO90_005721 [Microbotryomycetes sp. JL221]
MVALVDEEDVFKRYADRPRQPAAPPTAEVEVSDLKAAKPGQAALTRTQLNAFAEETNGSPMDDDTFKEIVEYFDCVLVDENDAQAPALTLMGFTQLYELQTGADEQETRKDLAKWGYNDDLQHVGPSAADDLFQWHFTIKGPGEDFEGGVYHGRMVLPSEYPFKPPEIYMSTPSGRFEVNKKICLSISSFHPETWQPSWGIRTALLALSAFFTTDAAGAVGSMDAPPAERRRLAKASRLFKCEACGFDAAKFAETDAKEGAQVSESLAASVEAQAAPVSDSQSRATIFPPSRPHAAPNGSTAPPSRTHHKVEPRVDAQHHAEHGPVGGAVAGAGPTLRPTVAPAPQVPVLQHQARDSMALARRVADVPHPAVLVATDAMYDAAVPGGGPLLVDRAILCVVLALVALIVRKLA